MDTAKWVFWYAIGWLGGRRCGDGRRMGGIVGRKGGAGMAGRGLFIRGGWSRPWMIGRRRGKDSSRPMAGQDCLDPTQLGRRVHPSQSNRGFGLAPETTNGSPPWVHSLSAPSPSPSPSSSPHSPPAYWLQSASSSAGLRGGRGGGSWDKRRVATGEERGGVLWDQRT